MHLWTKFGNPNLTWIGDEWWVGKAQNGVNFDFEVKFDLEGQGQSPPKTIGILTKVFYTYGPNLVILAWTGDELLRGQTDWRTDGQTQATTIPEGQYWPRVKNWSAIMISCIFYWVNRCNFTNNNETATILSCMRERPLQT